MAADPPEWTTTVGGLPGGGTASFVPQTGSIGDKSGFCPIRRHQLCESSRVLSPIVPDFCPWRAYVLTSDPFAVTSDTLVGRAISRNPWLRAFV